MSCTTRGMLSAIMTPTVTSGSSSTQVAAHDLVYAAAQTAAFATVTSAIKSS